MRREEIRTLIEMAVSFEEADGILSEHAGLRTDREKTACLMGMFD